MGLKCFQKPKEAWDQASLALVSSFEHSGVTSGLTVTTAYDVLRLPS